MKNERIIKNIIIGILLLATLWFGVRPIILGTSFKKYTSRRDLNFEENEYATIVVGSEPEGIAAALACSRTGLKTLLITKDSDLGSYIKASRISKMNPQHGIIARKNVSLNQGIYEEIFGQFKVGFSSDDYENRIRKLVESEESLDIIYDSFVLEADLEGEILKGILVQQPDGKHYYRAHNYIDASQNGDLLILCNTPYFKGSEDVGLPGFYAPLEFNFCVSGVDTKALKKGQKTTSFIDEFQLALLAYKKVNPRTKIISPSFIILNDSELVITGLQIYGADVEDEKDLTAAYKEAEEEAIMLTTYLKTVAGAFRNCTYKEGPEAFFIPEYRHFEGRYRLTVSDILENRNFRDKIALSAEAVDAGKFVDKSIEYIVAKPSVYSIPLGSIIPSNLQNVLMIGAKASFTSLAATSAGSLPTRITVGESAGLIAAYSFLYNIIPARFVEFKDKDPNGLKEYISRGGVYLKDFSEKIMIPGTEEELEDHWSYQYIKTLAEYGLISGGMENDFKLDYKASRELLAVLVKNAIIKIAPDSYSLKISHALKPYEVQEMLTGEYAARIVLDTLSVPWEEGKALETLKQNKILPESLTNRLQPGEPVTMDIVYGLAVETVKGMNH